MMAVRNSFKLAKENANILIFPEGIQSTIGSTHPMNPATLKFIKKLGVDVVLCHSYGSYLANPRFFSGFKKGPMEFHFSLLFTKEELEKMTTEEMYEKFLEKFKFNDFEWNKEKQYSYTFDGNNAQGFETILYECPICHCIESIKLKDNKLVCDKCGLEVEIDDKYNMISNKDLPFDTLDKWQKMQRESVREFIKNENFVEEYEVNFNMLDYHKLHKPSKKTINIGNGKLIFTKDKLLYKGAVNEEYKEIIFDYSLTPSGIILPGKGMYFYYDDELYEFIFVNKPNMGSRGVMLLEEIHNLNDPEWDKCCRDVF